MTLTGCRAAQIFILLLAFIAIRGLLFSPKQQQDLYETRIGHLQRRYQEMCHDDAVLWDSLDMRKLVRTIAKENEDTAFLFGKEAWNKVALDEISNKEAYFDLGTSNETTSFEYPFTVLSWGREYEEGMETLRQWGVPKDKIAAVSFPSVSAMYDRKEFVQSHFFGKMGNYTTREEFLQRDNHGGGMLSGMNQFTILEMLQNGSLPEEIMVVEDDAIAVPNFKAKLQSVFKQLEGVEWDMVFIGTCCKLHKPFSTKRISRNLYPSKKTRCVNGVLMNKAFASKILDHGVITYDYIPIDILLNEYVKPLGLKLYHVSPPLIYEGSKTYERFKCMSDDIVWGKYHNC